MPKIVQGYAFPDDATAEEIRSALAGVRPQPKSDAPSPPPPKEEMSWGEYGKGLARSAASGLTFNWSDELLAGARSKIEGTPFEQALEEERSAKKKFENQYPIAATAAEIAGGAPTMLIPGLGAGKVATQAAQSAGRLARMWNAPISQVTRAGATQGALGGLGAAEGGPDIEGIRSRLAGAAEGAAVGAGVGAGIKAAGNVLSPIGSAVVERFRPSMSGDIAVSKILQDLERSGMTPQQARDEFARLRSTGAAPSYFDVSGPLTTRAEAIAQREGAAAEGIVKDIADRQAAQRQRISGQAKSALGQSKTFYETADDAAAALRANAKPIYEKAYQAKIPVEAQYELQKIMNDVKKAFPSAISDAERLFVAERRGPEFKRVGTRELPSGNEAFEMIPKIQQWDYIMRALGDVIEGQTNVAGKTTQLGLAAGNIRREIADILDNNVPDFKAARAQYKGDIEVKQALEEAKKSFGRVDPEELAIKWKDMSAAEQQAYRAGALKNIRDSLFGSGDFTDATKRVGQSIQDRRDALSIIMPNKTTADLFQKYLEAEAKIAQNARRIGEGSPTARRIAAGKDLESGADLGTLGVASDIARSNWSSAMQKLFNMITSGAAIPEKRAEAIGSMLRANDMASVDRLTKSLESFLAERERKQAQSISRQKKIGAMAGRQAGEEVAEPPGEPIPTLTIRR